MNFKSVGTIALISVLAGVAYAQGEDDDAIADQCQSECVQDCLTNTTKADTAAKCGRTCVQTCRQDITAPQNTFMGPVKSTPVACPSTTTTTTTTATLGTSTVSGDFQPLPCASSAGSTSICAAISGTVANRLFFGGLVSIWVVCPAGTPFLSGSTSTTTTLLATTTSDPITGLFSFSPPVTGVCGGQTGCYGLIAVTPAPSGALTPDPNWSTCTNGTACPGP